MFNLCHLIAFYYNNYFSELQERVKELESETSEKYDAITSLQSNLGLSKAECRELRTEINVINQVS